jgi:ribosome-associated toxin RatA of RatAB toxin-antitoxin module
MKWPLAALLGVSANIPDPFAGEPGWVEDSHTDDYRAYTQDAPNGDIRKVLLIGSLAARPKDCFSVITDYESFPDFMPFVQYTKLLDSKKIDGNTTISHVFFFLNPPMIANRFYTIALVDEMDPDGINGAFRSKWTLEKGPFRKTPDDPQIKGHVKWGFKTPIEAIFNDGYWLFEPLEDGSKTKVSYSVWTNPGGLIPATIADKANAIALPKIWAAFKKRLAEKKFLKL